MRNRYIEGLSSYTDPHPFRRDADRLAEQFETDAYVKEGVVRWKSNDHIPPADILEFWRYLQKPFDFEQSLRISEMEVEASLAEYRRAMEEHNPSEEELAEMRAEFGQGATIVNVITGKTIRL